MPQQLAEVAFSGWCSVYLPDTAWAWKGYSTDGGQPWWVDCSVWPCLDLSPATTNVNGVALFTLRLTKNVLTGEITFQSNNATDVLARIEALSNYQPGARVEDRGVWWMWQQATNCPDCWGIDGEVPQPTVSLKVFLADVQNKPTWDEAVSALETAWEETQAASLAASGAFGAMAEDEGGDGGVGLDSACTITNEASPFSVLSLVRGTNGYTTVTWESCSDHIYGVLSTDQLNPSTVYTGRTAMWGLDGSTSWTDTTTTNVNARFYKIVRMPPNGDFDNDGLPNAWELQYGLDSLNPGDAAGDSNGDGYSNWDEFLMGTNPTATNDLITVYVDSMNTNGAWDGTQAYPFRSIQEAIESSVPVSSNLAIRVRPGTYYEPVSNLMYDRYGGTNVSSRQFLFLYAANNDWTVSTDPETHVIDTLGFQHHDLLLFSGAPSAPVVEFNGVTRAHINAFTLRGGRGIYAGGVHCFSPQGVVFISNCIIENNGTTGTEAGGIYFEALTNSLIYNTLIAKNTGQVGGIYDVNGTRIWNSTIVSNRETYTGVGGVWGLAPSNIRNSIAWGNGLDLYSVNVDYSVFGSNEVVTAGSHNLTNDPSLVNIAFGNYRLQTNSLLHAAGTLLPIERNDLYGNTRPVSGVFDIGANQFTDSVGDGIQDDWRIKHGVNPGDAHQDPDSDELDNLQEYHRNTNPHNPDTDGDGIRDDVDPDPTTADLVWDTVFWDYYQETVFSMYLNGVLDPRWMNNPPSSPRPVVLTDHHIGDHIFMQWHVESFGFNWPYLVFYVPHLSRGSIIPDVNAVPLNQIQFGSGDWAPPAGPWGFTIAETAPTNADSCAGFDDVTPLLPGQPGGPNPWLSVPNGGTNTFTVIINPTSVVNQIIFRSALGKVAISPSTATSATQLVRVVSLSAGSALDNDFLLIKGYGAQNSYTTTCATVNLDLLPKTNATVAIHKIIASTMATNPPVNVPTASELESYLDSVFGRQVDIDMSVLSLTTNVVNYDLDGDGNLKVDDRTEDLTAEEIAITNLVYTPGAFNIYYVNSLTNLGSDALLGLAYTTNNIDVVFVQDSHPNTAANLTAHEIGHLVGLDDLYTSQQPRLNERLMYFASTNNRCRLIRDEWRTANKLVPLKE